MAPIEQKTIDKVRDTSAKLLDSLIKTGGIEDLVRDGRIPVFKPIQTGRGKDRIMCIVPPKGTQIGDSMGYASGLGGLWGFWAPDGKARGAGKLLMVSTEQASILNQRIDTALEG